MAFSANNLCFFFLIFPTLVLAEPQVPCFFIFGDSLVDNGNNNHLQTAAKVNYLPYGIDFPAGSTGRFTNGRNMADFIAELLGFDEPIPPFSNATDQDSLRGVNYGSGGAGILDETGRAFFGDVVTMNEQLVNHKKLYEYGARKVAVFAVGKLGCVPAQLATYGVSNGSACFETSNDVAQIFNEEIQLLIKDLNKRLPNAKFVYTSDQSDNVSYGNIKVLTEPCCPTSVETNGHCVEGGVPCSNRDEYYFWDAFHPTEAATEIGANVAYNLMSPLYSHPIAVW